MQARYSIAEAVFEHPGITFREIQRETGLAVGTVQYHLRRDNRLLKEGGGYVPCTYRRDCELSEACQGTCLWRILRDDTKYAILKGLHSDKTQKQIAQELDVDVSTICYHVKRLREIGALEENTPAESLQKFL